MFPKLFGSEKGSAEENEHPQAPTKHAVEVKWDTWSPPGPNDGMNTIDPFLQIMDSANTAKFAHPVLRLTALRTMASYHMMEKASQKQWLSKHSQSPST